MSTAVLNTTVDLVKVRGPTLAAWDLRAPESGSDDDVHAVPDDIQFRTFKHYQGTLEKRIGPFDRRTPVLPDDIKEGGKYRSVVKLFLQFYKSKPGKWDIATGWLIKPDLIVTAGHCAYDWDDGLEYLTAVKCYIGYHGKDSVGKSSVQFRAGKRVCTPAQWVQSAEPHNDVSFIQLDKPFENVTPFTYVSTPATGNEILSVVGYPGDIREGQYMYEGSNTVTWDLANSDRFLDYVIDTAGGNSGSPVLKKSNGTAIGVHVLGGSLANSASVIGPLGNIFSFFIQAINAGINGKVDSGVTMSSPTTGVPVSNFKYIDFPPAAPRTESAPDPTSNGTVDSPVNGFPNGNGEFTNGSGDDVNGGTVEVGSPVGGDGTGTKYSNFFLRTLAYLRTNNIPFSVDGQGAITVGSHSDSHESGKSRESFEDRLKRIGKGVKPVNGKPVREKFTELPEALGPDDTVVREDGKEGVDDLPDGPPADQTEIKTTFFIGFPSASLSGTARDSQIALQKNVGVFWADATTKVERTVQAKIKDKKLDAKNAIAVSSYRAKCFDYYVRNLTTWIQAGAELTKRHEIKVRQLDFHMGILLAVLQGITVPASAFKQLEKIVQSIGDGVVKVGTKSTNESLTFWISMTTYRYEPLTQTTETKIRTVFFQSNEKTYTVTAGKSSWQEIDFVLEYQQYEAVFNNDIFDPIANGVRQDLIDKGKKMMSQSTLDVEV